MKDKNKTKEISEIYESIFKNATDGILVADIENKKFSIGNKTICQMLGYSLEEIKNMGVLDIHPEEDIPYVIEQFEKQSKKEIGLAQDIPVKRKKGSIFYADINSFPITLYGKLYLVGIFRDSTERKKTEESLRLSNEQLSILLESLPIVIYTSKAEGTFGATYISSNVFEVTGYKPEDFTSNTSFWAEHIHPDDSPRVFADLSKLFENEFHKHEYRWRIADGSYRWFYDSLRLMRSPDGTISHIVGMWEDITNRKSLEEELKRLAITDTLTGALNRTKFGEIIEREIERVKRYNHRLSMILFDIDHFKEINDRYGHNAGDYVLKTIADIVRESIRKIDYFVRWGGEEFIILSPETRLDETQTLAERIRIAIENTKFEIVGELTVSFGVTAFREKDTVDTFIKRADDAMYEAKRKGRNRVEVSI